jgi:hypothetical protein
LEPLEAPAAAAAAQAAASPVAAFAHVVELDALFIAASNGQLLLLDTSTREVDEVGVVTGGVAAAGWSPDGEQLAVLGFNGLLLIMNKVGSGCRVQRLGYRGVGFGTAGNKYSCHKPMQQLAHPSHGSVLTWRRVDMAMH